MGYALAGLAVLIAAAILVVRRVDVRLVLGLGALFLFALVGKLSSFFGFMAREMSNPETIIPIASAMGFAFVLRRTECDKHLVLLLLKPLRPLRALLVPGGIAAGYLVNTAIVSQSAAAAVLGPVLIPVLRAGGFSATTAGAVLLLGCSMGGELFNPAAVEAVRLSALTRIEGTQLIPQMARQNLMTGGTALLVFWLLTYRARRSEPRCVVEDVPAEAKESFRVRPLKALVPLIPLVILFVAGRFLGDRFLMLPKPFTALTPPARILAAMLIGVAAAGLTTPSRIGQLSTAFFEGAGAAYTQVISLIVTSIAFVESIKATGLITVVLSGLKAWPALAVLMGIALPWGLAAITGSGIAPAVAVMEVLVPEAETIGLDAVHLGAATALGAHLGRTMSLAAAVTMMAATLSGASPRDLVRRVGPPLLAGGLMLFLVTLLRLA